MIWSRRKRTSATTTTALQAANFYLLNNGNMDTLTIRADTAWSTLSKLIKAIFLSFGKNLKLFTSKPASAKASSMSSSVTVGLDKNNNNKNNSVNNNR